MSRALHLGRWMMALLLAAGMTLGTTAQAHQQKQALTTVLFNGRTGNIEVMHRFNLHDAEHAVRKLFEVDADIMKSGETQARFADHVAENFALYDGEGTALPLTRVGHERDGKHFWVYQEVKAPEHLKGLKVRHSALHQLWPSQINTVNLEGMGDIRTLTFDGKSRLLSVEF